MAFYLITNLFTFSVLFVLEYVNDEILKKILYYFVIILSFFIIAFRFDVGYDYVTYYEVVTLSGNLDLLIIWEPLTLLILEVVWFLNHPQFFFIIFSSLTYIFLLKGISKLSVSKELSLAFYLFFPFFYLESFSLIRQQLAMAILFYNLINLTRENKIKYILWVLVASSIHYAALITIIFYPLRKIKLNQNIYISIILFSLVSANLFKSLLLKILLYFSFYGSYFDNSKNVGGAGIMLYIVNLIGVLFFLNFNRVIKKEKLTLLYYNSIFIGIVLFNVLSPYGSAGFRTFLYFIFPIILIFPYLISCFKPYKYTKFISLLLLFFMCLLYVFIGTFNATKSPYTPYQNIIFIDEVKFK